MPTPETMVLPKTSSHDEFEKICKDVLSIRYNCRFEQYGRAGQKQNGIDLRCRDSDGTFIVAQCKNYHNPGLAKSLIAKIKQDIDATKELDFKIKKFIAITSMDYDLNVQKALIDIGCDEILFWNDVQSTICKNRDLLKTHYPSFPIELQQHELTFCDMGIAHVWGLYRLALVNGEATRVLTREAHPGIGLHLAYNLNITNKNDFSVKLHEIFFNVVDFKAISDCKLVSAIDECGGPEETNFFRGTVSRDSKVKAYPLKYLGFNDLEKSYIKENQYLRLEPGKSEAVILLVEFKNQASGIYRFTVFAKYIVDKDIKSYETSVQDYLHINLSYEKTREFYSDGGSNHMFDKIISIWEAGVISDDDYVLLSSLARTQREM